MLIYKMTWIYLKLKGKEKLQYALSELHYEMAEGVHTYHMCECGRKMCRTNMCVLCWEEEIDKLLRQQSNRQWLICKTCDKRCVGLNSAGEHAKKEHHYEFKTKDGGSIGFL